MAMKIDAGAGDFAPKRGDVQKIVPSQIVVDWRSNSSRQDEITEESVADLVADFKNPKVGQLQPASVRRRPSDNKVEIMSGYRRLKAALIVSRDDPQFRLRVEVLTDVSPEEAFLHNLIENVRRKSVTPIDLAFSARRLKRDYGYSVEDVATLFGVSVSQVRNLGQLLSLPESVQARVKSGMLGVSAALKFLKVDPAEVDAALEEATDEDGKVTGGGAAKAARSRGVKVGRNASDLRKVLAERSDAVSVALVGFLSGTVTPEELEGVLDAGAPALKAKKVS